MLVKSLKVKGKRWKNSSTLEYKNRDILEIGKHQNSILSGFAGMFEAILPT